MNYVRLKKNENEFSEALLANRLDKKDDLLEYEENALIELNDMTILSASNLFVRVVTKNDSNRKTKFGECFEKLPIKGIILAIFSAIFNSINSIFTKLITELSGKLINQ